MTKTIDDNMNQDTSTTTVMNKTTTRKRRAACDDNDNDSSNNHTSTGSLNNLTPNATNNEENSHQPFKRPRLPSPFTRQAERFEEALNREIEDQEDALRINEYRMLAVRALENEAHDRAFRDAMDVSSTYQQQQQYISTQNPSVAAAVDEDMDMDVDGDDYHNPQLEDHNGNGEGEEGQMVTPTVQETTQPTIPAQSGCLTSSLIGLDSNNNFTPIPIAYPIPTPRARPSNNNNKNTTINSSNFDFTIFEDIIPDRGGLLSFSPRPNRVASLLPWYLHYPYTNNNNNHHHNDNQEVRAYHQDWDSDKENINSNIVAGTLHDPVGMITETEAESFSQVVDRSFHDHYDADADEDEMRLDYDEGSPAAAAGGGGGESGRWGSGVPTWRVESESEYADTEVDPDDLGLGVHDYANRRRRRYHRLRWQSRVLGSQDRGSVALNSSNVLVPRMLGERVQGDGAGGVAGRGRRGPRRL